MNKESTIAEKDRLIACLGHSPGILRGLVDKVPTEVLKVRRKPDKWSIHEHACHLSVVEEMILERFLRFKNEENPSFQAYLPDKNVDTSNLALLPLAEQLDKYEHNREGLLDVVKAIPSEKWDRTFVHEEYVSYSPLILLRHTLMHDHLHMYRIEELWLTKDEFL